MAWPAPGDPPDLDEAFRAKARTPESEFARTAARVRAVLTSMTARPLITLHVTMPRITLRMEASFLQVHRFERPFEAVDVRDLSDTQLRAALQQAMDQGDRLLTRRVMAEITHTGRRLHMSVGDLLGQVPL